MAATGTPERLLWAVEVMRLKSANRVLEIGCGPGVAVSLLCDRLDQGTVTAIDRSDGAIAAARQRNREHVEAGRASFHTVPLEAAEFDDASFDKILAVNVNLFWVRDAAGELAALKRWLTPRGGLYLLYEPPSEERGGEIIGKVATAVAAQGFTAATIIGGGSSPGTLVGILAIPKA